MKHTYLLILCLFSSICVRGQEVVTIDNIKYYLENGEAMVFTQDKSLSGNIVIPEKVVYNGVEYFVNDIAASAFKESKSIVSIVLPNSITRIRDYCFAHCSALTSITLPENLTSLDDGCFSYCTSLTDIFLPNSVTTLGNSCFWGCSGFTSITLPENLVSLGDGCFQSCSNLTSIVFPENLNFVGSYCFYNCPQLTYISLSHSIVDFGDYCFWGCSSLTSIILPENITSLGERCFSYCSKLTSINLPENITSLGAACFFQCQGLTSIALPKNLINLGDACFQNCSNLFNVTSNCINPSNVLVGGGVFSGIFPAAKLYVPKGTKEMYAATEPWKSSFKTIIEKDSEEEEKPEVRICATPSIAYEAGKLVFSSETEGAQYHYTITSSDFKTDAYSEDGIVELATCYNISAWASAEGYTNSETSTATLYFVDGRIDDTDGVKEIQTKRGIVVSTANNTLTVSGLTDGETIDAYSLQGTKLAQAKAFCGSALLQIGKPQKVVILKVGNESIKVQL